LYVISPLGTLMQFVISDTFLVENKNCSDRGQKRQATLGTNSFLSYSFRSNQHHVSGIQQDRRNIEQSPTRTLEGTTTHESALHPS